MRGAADASLRLRRTRRALALAAALLVANGAIDLHASGAHRDDLGVPGRTSLVAAEAAHPAAQHHYESADPTWSPSCVLCALSAHRAGIASPAASLIAFRGHSALLVERESARQRFVRHTSTAPRGPPAS